MNGSTCHRILVVEDEMLVAMLVEDALRELGHDVIGPLMHLEQAIDAARSAEIDFAILDVNLGGGTLSLPVATILRDRGIPFIFATGYGSKAATDSFRNVRVLKKPFAIAELDRAIREATG